MNFSKSIVHSFSKSKRGDFYTKKATPGPGQYQYAQAFNLKKVPVAK